MPVGTAATAVVAGFAGPARRSGSATAEDDDVHFYKTFGGSIRIAGTVAMVPTTYVGRPPHSPTPASSDHACWVTGRRARANCKPHTRRGLRPARHISNGVLVDKDHLARLPSKVDFGTVAARDFGGTFRIAAEIDSDDEQEKFANLRIDFEVKRRTTARSPFYLGGVRGGVGAARGRLPRRLATSVLTPHLPLYSAPRMRVSR